MGELTNLSPGGVEELLEMLMQETFSGKPLTPPIPDPNQLSIPSEPVVRGDFTDRLPNNAEGAFSMAQFFANKGTMEKGDDIVLSQILKQLDELPSVSSSFDDGSNTTMSFPGIDIMNFMGDGINASRDDLGLGQAKQELFRTGVFKKDI